MKIEKSVLLLSAIDPTRAYSCIKYLYLKLKKQDMAVEFWCRVPASSMSDYKKWGDGTYSFCDSILFKIPKVRTWYMKFIGFIKCFAYRNRTIICHDLFHYKACSQVKKWFPNTKLIVYFTEIYNEKHSPYLARLQDYFEKHPNEMDIMIECDYKREEYRLTQNGVTKPSATILNTIPLSEVEEILKVKRVKNERPIVVFSGGVHEPGEFSIIIDALRDINIDCELDFYCFGTKEALNALQNECEEKIKGRYKLIKNKSREEVLHSIRKADVGIVYYDPEYSINTKYAAPTKFFEYVSLGIPVMASGNESLIKIIDEYHLGEYMRTNNVDGMREGLCRLLSDEKYRVRISQNEMEAFQNHLCYEIQSETAIKMITDLIQGRAEA